MSYRCPVCHQALAKADKQLLCPNRHSFDYAKEGYVNLLLAQQKKSREPGDSKAMMQSRRAFLDQGHYQLLVDALERVIDQHLEVPEAGFDLLDCGCGEGYYSAQLKRRKNRPNQHFFGVDISKPAIQLAAKRKADVEFAVASSFDLPFLDRRFDFALSIYAPFASEELSRVMKTDGLLIVVSPGPDHLYGLKEKIYPQPQRHRAEQEPLTGFRCIDRQQVKATLRLTQSADITQQLQMTPYYWHLDPSRQQQILSLEQLETPIDFSIGLFRPR